MLRKIQISAFAQWNARYNLADNIVYYGQHLLENWSEELYNEYLARQLAVSKTDPERKRKLDALARGLQVTTIVLQQTNSIHN